MSFKQVNQSNSLKRFPYRNVTRKRNILGQLCIKINLFYIVMHKIPFVIFDFQLQSKGISIL